MIQLLVRIVHHHQLLICTNYVSGNILSPTTIFHRIWNLKILWNPPKLVEGSDLCSNVLLHGVCLPPVCLRHILWFVPEPLAYSTLEFDYSIFDLKDDIIGCVLPFPLYLYFHGVSEIIWHCHTNFQFGASTCVVILSWLPSILDS